MPNTKYFRILGIPTSANPSEIKQAYRRLAMKYHPDRNSNSVTATEKFKEIKTAYEILTNKRTVINDQQSSDFSTTDFSSDTNNFEDIFGEFFSDYSFNNKPHSPNNKQYSDTITKIEVTIYDAVVGCKYSTFIPTWSQCVSCNGKKYIKKSKQFLCTKCNGTGYIKILSTFLSIKQVCTNCNGYGRVSLLKCDSCNGKGKTKSREFITINIPKGVHNGHRICLNSKGDLYNTLKNVYADYYFEVYIKKDDIFSLDSDYNIHTNVTISFINLLLGSSISIKTVTSILSLPIPQCTPLSVPIHIKRKGYPSSTTNNITDLIIHLTVSFPLKLSSKQYMLLSTIKPYFT